MGLPWEIGPRDGDDGSVSQASANGAPSSEPAGGCMGLIDGGRLHLLYLPRTGRGQRRNLGQWRSKPPSSTAPGGAPGDGTP
jgi:hypothetical protein